MAGVEANGKTVDEAIESALAELGATREEVEFDVLDEGRHGVLGVGSAPVRVRVWRIGEGPEPEGGDGEPEEDDAEYAAQMLDKLLVMMGIEADVSIRDAETPGDGLGMALAVLDVEGEDLGILIGRRGETLGSLQYLLNLMVSQQLGRQTFVTVDVEGYRQRRERALNAIARRSADQVKRTRKPVTLEPMPPNERRIIHLALAEDRYVTTASVGEGEARKVSNLSPLMSAPDFLVVGNVSKDLVEDGWRPGGTSTFAAVQAHRLGARVGVVARGADDFDIAATLPFADVVQLASVATTTFVNVYDGGRRTQRILARAGAIDIGDIPAEWRAAPIILLGPVFGEIDASLSASLPRASLTAVSAQGWLRGADDEQRVVRTTWEGPPFWTGADLVFVSDEDLADDRAPLDAWRSEARIVVMTESWRGAQVWADGAWRRLDAFPEAEIDPTGAGDTFAAAFLIRLHETGDPAESARFGAAAASLCVGGTGTATTPDRGQIEARMQAHPEIALR